MSITRTQSELDVFEHVTASDWHNAGLGAQARERAFAATDVVMDGANNLVLRDTRETGAADARVHERMTCERRVVEALDAGGWSYAERAGAGGVAEEARARDVFDVRRQGHVLVHEYAWPADVPQANRHYDARVDEREKAGDYIDVKRGLKRKFGGRR